jgi:hypothetical protein
MTASTRRTARTPEEWEKLAADTIAPALAAGATMTAMRAQYGTGTAIRRALARVGYDTKGQPIVGVHVRAASAKTLAKRVAARREEGAAWWRLELETEKSKAELKALLVKHGYESLTGVVTARRIEKAS